MAVAIGKSRPKNRSLCVALLALAGSPSFAQLAPPVGVPVGTGAVGGTPAVGARGSTVQVGVRATELISDNGNLASTGNPRQTGYTTEIAPYVTASVANARATGNLNYTLRGVHHSVDGGGETSVRHSLSASGNALLAGSWLGIQGSANTYYVSTSPFGILAVDPALSNVNTSRVTTYSISPYVVGQMGSFANYRAGYTYNGTDSSGGIAPALAKRDETVYATLSSGSQFRTWGWSLSSSAQQREFASGLSLKRTSAVASLFYVVSPELRLGASANHSYIQGLTNASGQSSGWGPGFSVDWTPSRRTTVRLNVVEDYYGTNSSLMVAHQASRWTLGLNYSRSILTSNNAALVTVDPASLFSAGGFPAGLNPVIQELALLGLFTGISIPVGAGVLSDALVRNQALTLSVGYLLPKGALTLSGFRTVRQTMVDSSLLLPDSDPISKTAFGRFESDGVSLGLMLPLSGSTNFSALGSVREAKSLDTPARTRMSTVSTGLSTRLNARSSASLTYRRSVQGAIEGGIAGYNENAVIATIDVRL